MDDLIVTMTFEVGGVPPTSQLDETQRGQAMCPKLKEDKCDVGLDPQAHPLRG